jgi:hypothetical protein
MVLSEPQMTERQAGTGQLADPKWYRLRQSAQDKRLHTNPKPEEEMEAPHGSKGRAQAGWAFEDQHEASDLTRCDGSSE